MNNTFSFSRFGKFFLYDLKRWISSYGITFIWFCLMPLVVYIIVPLFSLVFGEGWHSPEGLARMIVLVVSVFMLFLTYPSRVYGFITDKKAGSAYLMIPASTLEKFASMMLNALVVVPFLFSIVYFGLDALICAFDARCGESLICSLSELFNEIMDIDETTNGMLTISPLYIYASFVINILYFLLGAVLFKKNKVVYPILVMFGLQMVLSLLIGFLVSSGLIGEETIEWLGEKIIESDNVGMMISMFNVLVALINTVFAGGFAIALYFRLKTIKH